MNKSNIFCAYPSAPHQIGQAFHQAQERLEKFMQSCVLRLWEQMDIPGQCLRDPILESIDDASFLIADITTLNFNVAYEIGYAIGRRKRVFLVQNQSIKSDHALTSRVGIFDTLGYQRYTSGHQLAEIISKITKYDPIPFDKEKIDRHTPVYFVSPREKTDEEIRMISRLKKKARVPFRMFDPQESGRMSAIEAIEHVAQSTGVIIPLVASNRQDQAEHNLRCSFVAGLSHAMERNTLILQYRDEIVPADYRDVVSSYIDLETIDRLISEFAPQAVEKALSSNFKLDFDSPLTLADLQFGAPAAENETEDLKKYFLRTDEFQRVCNGEVQVVAGRKGSGKSALFFQARNEKRRDRKNIVLDLHPEGFQLKKLRTLVLDRLEHGTRDHTITAFWEYLFLLEICYKILEKDKTTHIHDHILRDSYNSLRREYLNDDFVAEGDFAERLLRLTSEIEDKFLSENTGSDVFLTKDVLTNLLYCHNVPKLKTELQDYLTHKGEVWILFDNIDKGWSSFGVEDSDLAMLRCLIEALAKMRNDFRKRRIPFFGVVFVRNDVYELLVSSQSDRGKVSRVNLDWTDPDLLRELIRLRLVSSINDNTSSFEDVWRRFVVGHLKNGIETSSYFIERSLMRPRALIEFLRHCKSHAVNLRRDRISDEDIEHGEHLYSTDLIGQISYELHDIAPQAEDVLYAFVSAPRYLQHDELIARLHQANIVESFQDRIVDLLLWYGFIGFVRDIEDEAYIYNVGYDIKKLKAMIKSRSAGNLLFCINPAFWKGLEIIS